MITSEQRAYLISDFKAASMSELRAMAASWGVIGRSKMRKAELVETLVNLSIERAEVREAQKKAMDKLHAEALNVNEKLTQIGRLEAHPSKEARLTAYEIRDELLAAGFEAQALGHNEICAECDHVRAVHYVDVSCDNGGPCRCTGFKAALA